jgi:hypothetical protein
MAGDLVRRRGKTGGGKGMPQEKPELYALLIGVDCYLPNELPGGYYYPNLGGCVRDISHVEAYLVTRLGMSKEHILKLTASGDGDRPKEPPGQWPTYENIIAKFREVSAMAISGDQVYIHYSGHGGRTTSAYRDLKGDDGLDEALVPADIGYSEARYVRDIEIAYLLKEMVAKGLVVTVVLDSCHSGGATRGLSKGIPRTMVPKKPGHGSALPVDTTSRPTHSDVASPEQLKQVWNGLFRGTRAVKPASGWLAEPEGYTLLAACRANESALEDCFDGRERNGALTYWMLDALRSSAGGMSYKMLHERILARIRSWAVEQTPQLQGDGDRVIFGSDRISTQYAIPVMQYDRKRNRIALNAGESHGLKRGDLLAIYPPGYADLDSPAGRQALARISEITGESDSWATIAERYDDTAIEQGAQAVFLGSADVRFQRAVGVILENPLQKKAVEEAVVKDGTGFIRLAGKDEPVDLQVAPGNDGDTYEIWDRNGAAIPNLRPAIRTTDAGAAEGITRRLVQLTKYLNVQAFQNPDAAASRMLELELIGDPVEGTSGQTPVFAPDIAVTLRIHNTLQPNPENLNDPARILNVTVLDLQPDWGIKQFYPSEAGLSEIVQPGTSVDVPLRTRLDEGYSEATDILKVFATQKTTSFRWMELPALDKPSVPRGAARGIISDPLEQFIMLLTADKAPSPEEVRTRAVEYVADSKTQKAWSVAQVEVRVK